MTIAVAEVVAKQLKAAVATHGAICSFINAASPSMILLFLYNDFYKTRGAYLTALADAMKA
jgi:5-methyltetrahydropteroyltriglutamate--homocysteine methyltransferase